MQRAFDEFGKIEYDDHGYAHRPADYAQRFEMLKSVAGLDNPWRPNRDGTFSTVYPTYSRAQHELAYRAALKMQQATAPTAARFGALPNASAPVDPEVLTDEPEKKEIPWKWIALGGVLIYVMTR